MKICAQKFQESRQAAVKLSIAAEGFSVQENPYRGEYCTYLRTRLLPAAELLTRSEDLGKLQALWELQSFSEGMLNTLLSLAAKEQKITAYVWLLKKKRDSCGFPARDFSL